MPPGAGLLGAFSFLAFAQEAVMTIAQKKAYLARIAASRQELAAGTPKKSEAAAKPVAERFGFKQFTVANGERGLLIRSQKIERIMAPGHYRFWDPLGRMRLRTMDVTRLEQDGRDVELLIKNLAPQLESRYSRASQSSKKHVVNLIDTFKDKRTRLRDLLNWQHAEKSET